MWPKRDTCLNWLKEVLDRKTLQQWQSYIYGVRESRHTKVKNRQQAKFSRFLDKHKGYIYNSSSLGGTYITSSVAAQTPTTTGHYNNNINNIHNCYHNKYNNHDGQQLHQCQLGSQPFFHHLTKGQETLLARGPNITVVPK